MAFSSSSCQLIKHDVFLSFRGEDTRKTFTSYLYQGLKRKGIGVYMDETDLKKGEKLSPVLLEAIKESKISIIIISHNYASSSWCLQELCQIMKCYRKKEQAVVPIFYRVDPSDVRKCIGSFGKAFADHHQHLNRKVEEVKRWKDDFIEVGSLSGWHIRGDMSDRSEPEYIEKIIQVILKQLTRLQSPMVSPITYSRLVGIYHQKLQIESLLCIGQKDIRIVGIWGMGGIGKTTLAQVIYDEVATQFEARCFMANVREEAEKHGIKFLRHKLVSTILDDENLQIGTSPCSIRSVVVNSRLSRKRVFIVLDDVHQWDQLEVLLERRDHFCPGSRIIVTSRDKQVLKIGVDEIYEVKELDWRNSLQLFSKYAFKQDHPARGFQDLSDRVLRYAGGIPMALKVLGSALYQKDRGYWESILKALKQYPHPTIFELLKISFDGLSVLERNIFLDIACFFKGENSEKVRKILNSCYDGAADFGLSNLDDKCIVDFNTLWMHDLVQEMGWEIVRQECRDEPGKRTRLWTTEDVSHVLKYNTGTKSIRGLLLDVSKVDEIIELNPYVFAWMHNLRFLKIYYSNPWYGKKECKKLISQRDLETLPGQLSYFHWEHSPLKYLPSNFCPKKLVEFRVPESNFERLWHGEWNLVNLEVLDVEGCENLTKIPSLSRAINIKRLIIDGCKSLVELPSMAHLISLRYFSNFRYLDNLKNFPEVPRHSTCLSVNNIGIEEVPEWIGYLNQLKSLDMSFSRVRNLPSTICALESLHHLNLFCCPIAKFPQIPKNLTTLVLSGTQIEEVPSSAMARLKNLVFLDMRGTRIQGFPSTIVKLEALDTVFLSGCPNITNFPNVPENIKTLYLDNTQIKEVPSSIARLKGLSLFSMRDCKKLTSLSTSICKLKSLRDFFLSGCFSLKNIMETVQSSISQEDPRGTAIKVLPSWSDHITGADNENSRIPSVSSSFQNLVALKTLDLSGSNIMEISVGIKQLPNLLFLYLRCCKNLKSLPELPPSLKIVDAGDCTSLEKVEKMSRPIESFLDIFWDCMIFSNCFNLDEDAIENIVTNAHLRRNPFRSRSIFCCLPGNEISKRFDYQSMSSSITIKMGPKWCSTRTRRLDFAFCVVVEGECNRDIGILCKHNLKTKHGYVQEFLYDWRWPQYFKRVVCFGESNHLFLLFAELKTDEDYDDIDEASFEFYIINAVGNYISNLKVKKCGVNFIMDI